MPKISITQVCQRAGITPQEFEVYRPALEGDYRTPGGQWRSGVVGRIAQLTQTGSDGITVQADAPTITNSENIDRSVFLSDVHIPEQDAAAVAVALKLIAALQPTHVFLCGDIFDFYQLSRFDQDPGRMLKLQAELDELDVFLGDVRAAAGEEAEVVFIEGNHESRLTRWLWKHPEVCSLRSMQPEDLFGLRKHRIAWHQRGMPYMFHGIAVTHGSIVRKAAGQSAKGEHEKYGTSGYSGHTHRVGTYRKRNLSGEYVWYEGGCLCDLAPKYVDGVADWHHAIGVGHFVRASRRFQIQQVNIVGGELLYEGVRFS